VWWDSDDGASYIYYNDGTSAQWVQFVGAQGPQGSAGSGGGSSVPRVVAYPYAATVTVDLGNTDVAHVGVLTGNLLLAFTGGYDGQVCRVRLPQDSTGGRAVTFDPAVKFSTTIPSFTASVAGGAVDYLAVVYYAATSKYHFASYNIGF
jgi:hypothetical protein